MKHKHADLIHAWADGAEIQYRIANKNGKGSWIDDDCPTWFDEELEYRIKPEEKKPVVRWLWAYKDVDGTWTWSNNFYTEDECVGADFDFKLEWSRTEFPE